MKYLALHLSERLHEKIFFIALFVCRQFCLPPPPPPTYQLIGCSWLASWPAHLTPSTLHHDQRPFTDRLAALSALCLSWLGGI
jgi:hypothetical protein